LLQNLLEVDGDFEKIPKKFRGALRCSVKETCPNFLVTDGSYFISAYFTPESYKQFRNENGSLRVTDLKDIMVQINKWTLELTGNSDSFTSYQGLEMKMIIHQMDLKKEFRVELKKFPTNLYRDDKMKTQIANFIGRHQRSLVHSKWLSNKKNNAAQVQSALEGKVKGSDSVVSLSNNKDGAMFKSYPFMDRKFTDVFAVKDIVQQEQGKKGLEDLMRKQMAQAKEMNEIQAMHKKESASAQRSEPNS
jgi:hypothetical protein